MFETILNAIPPEVIRGLGVGAATVPATWALVERGLKPTSSALTNRLTNVGVNCGAYLALHASGQVSFGPGWEGYLAALTYGVLAVGATEVLHVGIKNFAPKLTRPSGG